MTYTYVEIKEKQLDVLRDDSVTTEDKIRVFRVAAYDASYTTYFRSAGVLNPPKPEYVEFFGEVVKEFPDVAEKGMVEVLNEMSLFRPKENTPNLVREVRENGKVMTGFLHPLSFTTQGFRLLDEYKKVCNQQLAAVPA